MAFWVLSGYFLDTPFQDPFLHTQERRGCYRGDDLRSLSGRTLPHLGRGVFSHLLLVPGPLGIWGQLSSRQGAAHSPPCVHPGMQPGCIVSGASRAALLVPCAAGLLPLELGKGRQVLGREAEVRLGWAGRKGGRRQAAGVVFVS